MVSRVAFRWTWEGEGLGFVPVRSAVVHAGETSMAGFADRLVALSGAGLA